MGISATAKIKSIFCEIYFYAGSKIVCGGKLGPTIMKLAVGKVPSSTSTFTQTNFRQDFQSNFLRIMWKPGLELPLLMVWHISFTQNICISAGISFLKKQRAVSDQMTKLIGNDSPHLLKITIQAQIFNWRKTLSKYPMSLYQNNGFVSSFPSVFYDFHF